MSNQFREILNTDSQDMLVLLSTVVSSYNNCCTDGSTSPRNYGYPLVYFYLQDVSSHGILKITVFWDVTPNGLVDRNVSKEPIDAIFRVEVGDGTLRSSACNYILNRWCHVWVQR
jgi:hypothetical protein